jgi:hypothetical protein
MFTLLMNDICQIYETTKDYNGQPVTEATPTEIGAAFDYDHRTYPKYNTEMEVYDVVIYLPPEADLDMNDANRYRFQRKGDTRLLQDYEIEAVRDHMTGAIHHYEVVCK